MNSAANRNYTIRKGENTLIFTTPAFRTELDSVLHSGIYNREFAAVLTSAVVAGLASLLAAMKSDSALLRSLVFLLILAGGFPLFRKYVFREVLREVVFNSARGEALLSTSRTGKRAKETIPLHSIKDVSIETQKRKVGNADAVEFIEKISLQHGTVIPGFGRESVLFLLKLYLNDGTERIVYADTRMQDVIAAHAEIKEFLGI